MSKKIVVISYATYPGISPRNFRTDELTKELARQGHDVTLYILEGGYNYEDYEKKTNIKVASLGHTHFFKFNHDSGVTQKLPAKVIRKILGNYLEFPNIELVFNTYNALRKETDIDLLITVAAPHPLHWGAAVFRVINSDRLKNTVWVADCGDPYMGNAFHKKPFYFKYLEKLFSNKADFISIPIEEAREAYYPEFSEKIKVIPQGFNFEDVKIEGNYKKNKIPSFIYAGIFYPKIRDPRPLLDYLLTLDKDFHFSIYTKTPKILEVYIDKFRGKLSVFGYIPRIKLIDELSKADFLLNLENPSGKQSPSKLIDYSLSGRPILSIDTNKEIDKGLIDSFLDANYNDRTVLDNMENFNIKNVANRFIKLCR